MPLNQKTLFRILLAALMLQAISIGYYAYFVDVYGFLPSPFVADKADTFMDLYHTMWWGAQDGRYTEWQSIYPPVNFIIVGLMRLFFIPSGAGSDPVHLRSISLWPAYIVTALHVIAPIFVVTRSSWRGFSGVNRTLIALGAIFSPVFLFSIERGNLIVLPLFFLPFIFAGRDSGWKTLLLAICVNLKPYFALLIFAYAFVGNWRRFLQCLAYAGGIFLLTGLMEDPNFLVFLANIPKFTQGTTLELSAVLALPNSPSAWSLALLIILGNEHNPSLFMQLLPKLIEAAKTGVVVLVLLGLFRSRRSVTPPEAFVLLLALVMTAGIWAGGYSQIFYLAIVPVLLGMRFRNAYLLLVAAIFLPWDLVTLHANPAALTQSFITRSNVVVSWQLGLGAFARPLLNMALIVTMATELSGRANTATAPIAGTSASNFFPDLRLLLPAGILGLILGAALYHFAISSQVSTTILQMGADPTRSDPQQFLTLMLEKRARPQLIMDRLETAKVASEIGDRMGNPALARQLADQRGDGGLIARLSGDARFLKIKVDLRDRDTSLRSAAIAADIATHMDDDTLSPPPAQMKNAARANWRDMVIQSAIFRVVFTEMPDSDGRSLVSPDPMARDTDAENSLNPHATVLLPATLATPIIDSWWLGALIGAVGCGSIAYGFSLSRAKRKALA